jgi:hypothetical protein
VSLVYLCMRKSGLWTIAPKGQATMPPFDAIDGPYDYRVAKIALEDRNARRGKVPRHKPKEDRFDLWK